MLILSKFYVRLSKFHQPLRFQTINQKFYKNASQCRFRSNISTENKVNNIESKLPVNFTEMINERRTQAKHSILVQVNSERSFPELYTYCSRYGVIRSAYHYVIPTDNGHHYILLEYQDRPSIDLVIRESVHSKDSVVPVASSFLWFRAGSKSTLTEPISIPELNPTESIQIADDSLINDQLDRATDLNDQISMLYQLTRLNETGIRLRFLAAVQLEQSLIGMFPTVQACPFGSSVSGYGKQGCDLDLILRFCYTEGEEKNVDLEKRLVFHTKDYQSTGRVQIQRHMECIGDLLQLFLPGTCHVRRILQARIPIIRYHHEHLNLEIDLSMSNLSGYYMSELLYMFGEIDVRVKPLIFSIRQWAKAVGITNPSPGRWISNFSLTCLVIFYLQQLQRPVIPSIGRLTKLARSQDVRVTEDNIDCTFLRDLSLINHQTTNVDSLATLLRQFYEFYAQFDFNTMAISLNDGKATTKPEHSAMYIVNPIEIGLNVSKNVSFEECERFRAEVRNAAWILESEEVGQRTAGEPWGLMALCRVRSTIRPQMFFKSRMVDVSDLFGKGEPVKYHNGAVKKSVANIKKETGASIRELKARKR